MTEQSDDQKKLENLQDRMNKLSGYPVWQKVWWKSSERKSNDDKPSLYINIPEGTIESSAHCDLNTVNYFNRYLPYNYSQQINKFITDHNLGDVIKYEPRQHRDDHDCRFSIITDDLDKLRTVVERLEGKLGTEFQQLMQGMLLAANPSSVYHRLTFDEFVNVATGMGKGTLGELSQSFYAQPLAKELAFMQVAEQTGIKSLGLT